MARKAVFVLFPFLFTLDKFVEAKPKAHTITVRIPARLEECYYLPNVTKGQSISLEFQVVDSGSQTGSLDVSLYILDPNGGTLQSFDVVPHGAYHDEAPLDGVYAVCVDNEYSTLAAKSVYIDIAISDPAPENYAEYVYDGDEDIPDQEMLAMKATDVALEDTFKMKVKEIKEHIRKIRTSVGTARSEQEMAYIHNTKDYHNVVNLQSRLTLWSSLHVALVILSGLIQVYIVRRLFHQKTYCSKHVSENVRAPTPTKDLLFPQPPSQ